MNHYRTTADSKRNEILLRKLFHTGIIVTQREESGMRQELYNKICQISQILGTSQLITILQSFVPVFLLLDHIY